jgi:hypothetical protein
MVEQSGTDGPHRPARTPRAARSPRTTRSFPVTGFPGWTHLIATLAFAGWSIGTTAHLYGIDTRYDWWQGFGSLMTVLTVAVLVFVLPPAVVLEAWAVTTHHRWFARIPVICYVLIAGFISFVPTGLRFFGDTSPTPVDEVTLSLVSYGIVIGAQVLCAYLACRLWTRRVTP